jgi:diaminopimelate epimerase
MPVINAFRMNGLGNNFIIVDRRKKLINISKDKIIELGNRVSFHRNIEFDQIIFIEKEVNKAFPITIFNSDGTEISACGNGSRCIAYFLSEDLNTKTIKLKTNDRFLDAKIVGDFNVQLKMGKPIFDWDKIPLRKKLDHDNITLNIDDKIFTDGFCLNVGNPHIIFFVKNCFKYDLKILGPKI